ncbi:hypothetical protein GH714_014486 [Hevea brasiliensis]|uniref:Uncharacterized protein n=1 Tax=Hevea brasiliensis TaxID=3981 RepID=A0A6A6K4K9_HEVBR|nr:hypothetical protein GH714_014486 [Hevea brasiliensis]
MTLVLLECVELLMYWNLEKNPQPRPIRSKKMTTLYPPGTFISISTTWLELQCLYLVRVACFSTALHSSLDMGQASSEGKEREKWFIPLEKDQTKPVQAVSILVAPPSANSAQSSLQKVTASDR